MNSSWRIPKQIFREFWLPFLIGLLWTWYSATPTQGGSLVGYISNFSGSFFLASWAIAQFLRIKRQHAAEDFYKETKESLSELEATTTTILPVLNELNERTKNQPSLQTIVQNLSNLISTANSQANAANTAFSAARSRASQEYLYGGSGQVFAPVYVPEDKKPKD